MDISRRVSGKLTGAGAFAASGLMPSAIAQTAPKVVVVVGGGAGGATVAHHIKKDAPNVDVTLIEINRRYSASFFSNLYLGGFRTLESLNHGYGNITGRGQSSRPTSRTPHTAIVPVVGRSPQSRKCTGISSGATPMS